MEEQHTYDKACRLAAVVVPEPDNTLLDGIPPINTQYFYHSLIPIDDPLSTATVPVSSDTNKSSRAALRPFSQADNNALERAWLSLAVDSLRYSHQASLANFRLSASVAALNVDKLQAIVDTLLRRHQKKHGHQGRAPPVLEAPSNKFADIATPVCCQELLVDASNLLRETFCELTRKRQKDLDQGNVVGRVMAAMEHDRPKPIAVPPHVDDPLISTSSPRTEVFVAPHLSTSTRGRASSLASNTPASRAGSTDSRPTRQPMSSTPVTDKFLSKPAPVQIRRPVVDDGISGKPFLSVEESKAAAIAETLPVDSLVKAREDIRGEEGDSPAMKGAVGDRPPTASTTDGTELFSIKAHLEVPVGISRLHLVSLPALQMKPLYWSPVNDIAVVTRATWFYR